MDLSKGDRPGSRRGTVRARWPILSAVVAAITGATNAQAVEREHQVGLDLGGAVLVVGDKSDADLGAAFGAHYTYGLSDQWLFMARAAISPVAPDERANAPNTPNDRPSGLVGAGVGIGYVLDVMRWVPYAGLLVDGYALYGGTLGGGPRMVAGVSVALGVDYRIDRTWSVGASLHENILSEPGTYPSLTQAFANVDMHWGWKSPRAPSLAGGASPCLADAESVVERPHGKLRIFGRNQATNLDFARRDRLNVDSLLREDAKHLCRDARM